MAIDFPAFSKLLSESYTISDTALRGLHRLYLSTLEQARKVNLFSSTSVDNLWIKLAHDSLAGVPFLPTSGSVLDVGSGGGIPALVYAALCPTVQFTLTEPVNKKAIALERIRYEVGLQNVIVLSLRAQDIENKTYDFITARAVAPFPQIWLWTTRVRRVGTEYVLFRGSSELLESTTPDQLEELERIPVDELYLWRARVIA